MALLGTEHTGAVITQYLTADEINPPTDIGPHVVTVRTTSVCGHMWGCATGGFPAAAISVYSAVLDRNAQFHVETVVSVRLPYVQVLDFAE